MTVSRQIPLILCMTLLIGACASAPVTQTPSSSLPVTSPSANPDQLSSDIRPTTKGQRLELTGDMEIPAGTSSYTIQSASAPQTTRMALLDLLIAPAWAQDAVSEGDEPISDDQLTSLTATVNDESVKVSIDKIEEQADGSKLVKYTLKDVPESDDNAVIVFSSPAGAFKIKGVVPKLSAGLKKLERFNIETTALAEVLLNHPKKLKRLSEAEIHALIKSDEVQKVRDQVLEVFVHPIVNPGAKPPRFEDAVRAPLKKILAGSVVEDFLNKQDACDQRGPKCLQRPALPPAQVHPIPAALTAAIQQRQALRVRVIQGSHVATLQERTELLKLGPVARRAQCVQRQIFPCPGI